MALKLWLPLTNDVHNQGIQATIPINTGTTLSTAGPLGNSHLFNGTNNKIQTTYKCSEDEMTVCMWVTFTKLSVHLLDMRNQSGIGYQPAYVSSSGIQVGGSSNNAWPYINFVPSLNTWYHLAIVYTSSGTKLYVNGEYYGQATNSLGHNYNIDMQVHIGSRYSNANWFGGNIADFRIYNEALSAYEVKVIARGLLLHYTYPTEISLQTTIKTTIVDSSGFGRNAVWQGGSHGTGGNNSYRYKVVWKFPEGTSYMTTTSPSSNTKTICFWLLTPKTNSTVFFADYKSKMGFGIQSSGYIITSCDSLSVPIYSATNLTANAYTYIVLRKNEAGTDIDLFINGVQQTSRSSNSSWTHNTDTLMIGQRSTGTPMPNAHFSDFRMYATRLSDEDIMDLYKTQLKQLDSGKSSPFELYENEVDKVQIQKSGRLITNEFVESTVNNKFKSTQAISNDFIER